MLSVLNSPAIPPNLFNYGNLQRMLQNPEGKKLLCTLKCTEGKESLTHGHWYEDYPSPQLCLSMASPWVLPKVLKYPRNLLNHVENTIYISAVHPGLETSSLNMEHQK